MRYSGKRTNEYRLQTAEYIFYSYKYPFSFSLCSLTSSSVDYIYVGSEKTFALHRIIRRQNFIQIYKSIEVARFSHFKTGFLFNFPTIRVYMLPAIFCPRERLNWQIYILSVPISGESGFFFCNRFPVFFKLGFLAGRLIFVSLSQIGTSASLLYRSF